jgi:hypothetical protein
MARSGRDCNLEDQRGPVIRPRPPIPERHADEDRPYQMGRGGSSEPNARTPTGTAYSGALEVGFSDSQRMPYREPDRERTYTLRDSELRTLAEIGTFRAVTLDDLTRYRYGGNNDEARSDLENLDCQNLIRRRTTYPEHTVYLTLTPEGHRFIERHRPSDMNQRQVLYHGFVKAREARHDAALYRLYLHEAERIRAEGGKMQRIILDFELKKSINRKLSKLDSLPPSERAQRKQQIAQEDGLMVVKGKIPVPDLRLEYETPDQQQTKVDLELATGDYHRDSLAAKAKAGFAMYALPEDAARLSPAMRDPEIMQEIFSL